MANQELYNALMDALERDDPRSWTAAIEPMYNEVRAHRLIEATDYTSRKPQIDALLNLKDCDFSGKVFNGRVYADHKFAREVAQPEHHQKMMHIRRPPDYYFDCLNLSGCDLSRAIFRGCGFRNNDMAKVKAEGAVFAACQFTPPGDGGWGAGFQEADLRDAKFHMCAVYDTQFTGADLKGATFSQCTLKQDDRIRGYSDYAMFRDAKLDGVSFIDCDLSHSEITKEQLLQCASIEGSKLPPAVEKYRVEIEEALRKKQRGDEGKAVPQSELDKWAEEYDRDCYKRISKWNETEKSNFPYAMRIDYAECYGKEIAALSRSASSGEIIVSDQAAFTEAANTRIAGRIADELMSKNRLKDGISPKNASADCIAALNGKGPLPSRLATKEEMAECKKENDEALAYGKKNGHAIPMTSDLMIKEWLARKHRPAPKPGVIT